MANFTYYIPKAKGGCSIAIARSVELTKESTDRHVKPVNTQTHVHEFLGSTKLAVEGDLRHNHRFAGVTSEAIPQGDNHVHAILTNTDFFFNHLHEVGVLTGPAIPVANDKHVHFVEGVTTLNFGHVHEFVFATLIEDPLL